MRFAYITMLVATIACLGLIDWRYKLAYFYDKSRTIKTLAVGIILFTIWDVAGIVLKIFFIGDTPYLTGIRIGQFPIEELFFLTVLCYSVLIAFRFIENKRKRS